MRRLQFYLRQIILFVLLSTQLFFFQNCSEPFDSINSSANLSSGLNTGLDIIPPNLQVLVPQAGAYIAPPFRLQGTCEYGLDVSYEFKSVNLSATVPCEQAGFSIDAAQLLDGNHRVEITQLDSSGNKALLDFSFQVDKTAPVLTFTLPAVNANLTAVAQNVMGSCESGLSVVLSGAALAAPVTTSCASNTFQSAVTLVGANGAASITAEQTDGAGNKTLISRSVNINLPATIPVVKISTPAANFLTRVRNLTLTGTCVAGLNVAVSGSGIAATSTACANGTFSAAINLTAGDGAKAVTVSQTNAKNETGQDARSFQLDMTAPALTIASPAAGSQYTTSVALAGTCENGLQVTAAGTGAANSKVTACTNGMFQVDVAFSAGLGVKAITLSQTDAAGNVGTLSRNFERIDPPPVITDGKILYANHCQSCHNPIANSAKQGTTAVKITNAIANVSDMKFLKLTSAEIDAIAAALIITVPPPTTGLPTLALPNANPAANSNALFAANAFGVSGMRRLSRHEVINSVRDILTVSPAAFINSLPEDLIDEASNPFDNDISLQSVSLTAIEQYDKFAEQVATDLQGRTAVINTLAGCTPNGNSDSACFAKFVSNVARLFLRREITSAEQTKFANAFLARASAVNNYYVAPALMVQALIMHPEFLNRVEVGTAVAGSTARALTDYEIATRMSYLIWGSAPDKALLDAAASGSLRAESTRLTQAQRLLQNAKAKTQAYNFHAQWLGYEGVGLPTSGTLANDMKQETNKLIEDVLFTSSGTKWLDIFSSSKTYLTPALATHYGFASVGTASWVNYTGERAGIMSHGQFLAQGAKFGDTSPTLRGYRVLKRVFCQKFGPVPVGVDPDNPPAPVGGSNCKNDTYNMRHQTACSGCHMLTDNIGFGLENFSPWGQWRVTEPNRPTCNIKGEGAVGTELFTGPKQLGQMIATHSLAAQCASRQLFRYALGRADNSNDANTVAAMHAQYNQTPRYVDMLQAIVRSQAFAQK